MSRKSHKYKPRRREVFGEIVGGPYRFSRDVLFTKDAAVEFAQVTGLVASFCYYIPSMVRIAFSDPFGGGSSLRSEQEKAGLNFGLVTGVALLVGQAAAYCYALENEHYEAFLIPIGANLASLTYEVGRSLFGKAEERVIEQHKFPS